MGDLDDRRHDSVDPDVRRAYREWSDERTPAEVNHNVLRAAAEAVGKKHTAAAGPLRPLAFAATLVLGIALLFEMQQDTEPALPATVLEELSLTPPQRDSTPEAEALESAPSAPPVSTASPADIGGMPTKRHDSPRREQRAAEVAHESTAETGVEEFSTLRKRAPANGDRPQQSLQDFNSAVSDSTGKLGASRQAGTTKAILANDALPGACDADEVVNARLWWHCIETLREAGKHEAAAIEIERLRERFPESSMDR